MSKVRALAKIDENLPDAVAAFSFGSTLPEVLCHLEMIYGMLLS